MSRILKKKSINRYKELKWYKRLRPCVQFEVQKSSDITVLDPSLALGYYITHRWVLDFSYMYRLQYHQSNDHLGTDSRIYGGRVAIEFDLIKKLYPIMVLEQLRTYVPFKSTPEVFERKWVPGLMFGLKKEFEIVPGFNGDIMALFNLLYDGQESPYNNRFNVRFGFILNKAENKGSIKKLRKKLNDQYSTKKNKLKKKFKPND